MLNESHPYSRLDSHSHHFLLPRAADIPSPEPRRMDQQPSSSGRGGGGPTTPRRQLQGPRPPRLNVRMESHAIKKPAPSGPPPPQAQAQGRRDHQHQLQQAGPAPARAPVIIYDASPKVIHAKPSEFMALVQRLTGPDSGALHPEAGQEHHQANDDDMLGQPFLPPELLLSPSAAMSPAARLATIERSVRPLPEPAAAALDYVPDHDDDGTLAAVLGPAPPRPGILSPLPSSLPHAAALGVFSPLPFDLSGLSWLNELSPILRAAGSSSAPGAPTNAPSRPPPPPPTTTPTRRIISRIRG
ncbi:hypothetical protein PR202_gb15706 [Eleusine coracana subsp. coracana]|uniref:VQ domain-containing protein n=1 Tax=Eleusine coracana subsp. coracana TaxID=191504 RepID=A0AAV5EYK5_ELECO|nr:hypothetical protein PR202_gb15706 [Eleusine coracana subsp. coracana]